jgi:hypothetical protein
MHQHRWYQIALTWAVHISVVALVLCGSSRRWACSCRPSARPTRSGPIGLVGGAVPRRAERDRLRTADPEETGRSREGRIRHQGNLYVVDGRVEASEDVRRSRLGHRAREIDAYVPGDHRRSGRWRDDDGCRERRLPLGGHEESFGPRPAGLRDRRKPARIHARQLPQTSCSIPATGRAWPRPSSTR